jgi:glycine cleavage system H protein
MPPNELMYNETHLWVHGEDGTAVIGVTEYGLDQYGDVVACELAEVGAELTHGDDMGELECTRGVWDLYAPLDGVITEVNQAAVQNPEHINDDPYGDGWLIRISVKDKRQLEHLLTAAEYQTLIEEEAEEEEEEEEEEEDEFGLLEE